MVETSDEHLGIDGPNSDPKTAIDEQRQGTTAFLDASVTGVATMESRRILLLNPFRQSRVIEPLKLDFMRLQWSNQTHKACLAQPIPHDLGHIYRHGLRRMFGFGSQCGALAGNQAAASSSIWSFMAAKVPSIQQGSANIVCFNA